MNTRTRQRNLVATAIASFVAGMAVMALLLRPSIQTHANEPRPGSTDHATSVTPDAPARITAAASGSVVELRRRALDLPVEGVTRSQLRDSFQDVRGAGREHGAIDILAARNTPVRAVEDGRIAKLFLSKAGGITVYQFDPSERFAYYYAHLERYAAGLAEGQTVHRGQVIGYVGTSGNAPKDTPHLHFAVFELTPEKKWWKGTPIDPFDVFSVPVITGDRGPEPRPGRGPR